MTVSYAAEVATSRGIPSCFVKLLRKWRGSIYKIIYCDLIIFLSAYYTLNLVYRYLMNAEQQTVFHDVVAYFKQYNSIIPLSFVLGFYVSIIVGRWCQQFLNLPWPDPTAVVVSTHIRGQDERGRKMRRTVMRYVCLCQIMVYRLISPKTMKRFPTYDHLVEAGVLNENEKNIILAIDEIYPKQPKYWMPIVWASSIFTRARKEGRIRDDFALRSLNDSINSFRASCIILTHYDTISIPLVYTQVVSLAVYSYFFAAVIGQQWTKELADKNDYNIVGYYFPIFLTLEFIFYMGWLKVAESLICPFGEDDDDFDVNYMIDRNLLVSYLIVDEMHNRHPQLLKDQYWDEIYPSEMPGGGSEPPEHSTAHLDHKGLATAVSTAIMSPEKEDSKVRFLFMRNPSQQDTERPSTRDNIDTDSSEDIEVLGEVIHVSSPSEISITTLQREEEEESESEEYTFEKLREERERERLERQQQKVQRTVENVAEVQAELRIRKSEEEGSHGESSETDEDGDERNRKTDEDKKKTEKKD